MTSGLALNLLVAASALTSVATVPRVLARRAAVVQPAGRRVGPGVALAGVVALIYLNQVAFTVYITGVHGGDADFIAQYLPDGWFSLLEANNPVVVLASGWPHPELLAPSLLRVPALLELPFVLLAFLTVLRWLDPGSYRAVARSPVIWLASASYSGAFCLIEWQLRNPYTGGDLVLRAVSALVTPAVIRVLTSPEGEGRRPPTPLRLVTFTASAAALGHLVLVVYETALLYNLGILPSRLPGAAVALVVLAVARVVDARTRAVAIPFGAVATAGALLRWFLVLFLVPALAIRYGVTFGSAPLALAAALLVAVTAVALTLRAGALGGRPLVVIAQLVAAAAAGLPVAYAVTFALPDDYVESTLLWSLTAFLCTAVAVSAVTDRSLWSVAAPTGAGEGAERPVSAGLRAPRAAARRATPEG